MKPGMGGTLERIAAVIESRKGGDAEKSYVAKLLASGEDAVLALTTDAPVPDELLEEILKLEGFHAGRAIDF